jgi:hypothetical protein
MHELCGHLWALTTPKNVMIVGLYWEFPHLVSKWVSHIFLLLSLKIGVDMQKLSIICQSEAHVFFFSAQIQLQRTQEIMPIWGLTFQITDKLL